jgi:hypothetical protein
MRGFVLLGLDEKSAWYAAFALHALFAYPTSESWWPWIDKQLPINVARMGRTSWGRNWGNFDRINWIEDLDIDMVGVVIVYRRPDADDLVPPQQKLFA